MSGAWFKINGEVHSSKNSRRIFRNSKTGRPFVSKSKASKEDEGNFSKQLDDQKDEWQVELAEHTFPIAVVFRFRRKTRAKFDHTNIVQGLLDAMVKAEWLPDDSNRTIVPLFAPEVHDKTNPGVDFKIVDYGMWMWFMDMVLQTVKGLQEQWQVKVDKLYEILNNER